MRVNNVNLELGIPRVGDVDGMRPTSPSPVVSSSFGPELMSAMETVDTTQRVAEQKAIEAAEGTGNIHEVALALEQADVTMKVAVRARNKVVEAYQEIMRMQV
jgi:flagellar hook-basal body complex protein FliE